MPRNAEKNVYITIAFARTSPTLEHLQREATDMGISVANLIKVLLADRTAALEGQDKQRWFPHEGITAQQSLVPLEKTEISPPPVEDGTARRAAAAASAANYWDD
jgi:hypothetical protein